MNFVENNKAYKREGFELIYKKNVLSTLTEYLTLETLQTDLDNWIHYYNNERTHQGKMCCGRTPITTLLDGKQIWEEKNLNQI